MQRSLTIIIALFHVVSTLTAQNQYASWVFGDHYVLSWSKSGQISREPTLTRDGGFWTIEGSGVWSDTCTGKLILQTDGSQIMDGSNSVVPGSLGLCGGPSSAQNAVIIPWPGRSDVYFVFVSKMWTRGNQDVPPDADCNSKQYTYSIVDLSGPTPVLLLKSVPIDNGMMSGVESIAATKAADGFSYWLLTANTDTYDFRTFRIDESGLNTNPVISAGAPRSTTDLWKFSPDGRFLVSGASFAATLFDFDNATGRISNPRVLRDATIGSPFYETVYRDRQGMRSYGLEFSPSSDLLYVMTYGANPKGDTLPQEYRVLQFDLRSTTSVEIANSVQVVYQSADDRIQSVQSFGGHMQLAIDGRIWFNARSGLDVIEYPDELGSACRYRPDYISIPDWSDRRNHGGFPTVIASDLGFGRNGAPCRPPWPSLEPDTICAGQCTTILLRTANEVSSVRWWADGGVIEGTDTADTLRVCYDTPGTYTVKAVTGNAHGSDEVVTQVVVREAPTINVQGDSVVCRGASARFAAAGTDSVVWYVNGVQVQPSTSELILPWVVTPTVITAVGWNTGSTCRDSQEVLIRVDSAQIMAISDTVVCPDSDVLLKATGNGTIQWYGPDGSSLAPGGSVTVSPSMTTTYTAVVKTSLGCSDTARVAVLVLDAPQAAAWGDTTVCPGERVNVGATPGFSYRWAPPGVFSDPSASSPTVIVDATTLLTVEISDENGCTVFDSVLITVESSGWVQLGGDTTVCEGSEVLLVATASGGGVVEWIDEEKGVLLGSGDRLIATTSESMTIVARLADQDCAASDTMRITMVPAQQMQAGPDTTICGRQPVVLWSNGSENAVWFDVDGRVRGTGSSITISPPASTILYVTDECADTAEVRVTVVDPTDRVYVIGSATVDVGSIVDIPIDIAGAVNASGELLLEYDGRLVDFTTLTGGQLLSVNGRGQQSATVRLQHDATSRMVLQGRTMVAPVTSTVITGMTSVDSCGSVLVRPGELQVVGCGLPLRSIVTGGVAVKAVRYSPSNNSSIIVSLEVARTTDFSVDLYDVGGQQVYRAQMQLSTGNRDLTIPAGSLAVGMYILRYSAGASTEALLIAVGF